MHRTTWFEWQLGYSQYHSRLNPLISDDECTRLVSLGACSYIVGEIGFEDSFGLAKRVEQRDGHSHDMLCACLHDLGWVQKGLGGTGSQTSIETAPLPLWGLNSGTVGSFQLGKVFTG